MAMAQQAKFKLKLPPEGKLSSLSYLQTKNNRIFHFFYMLFEKQSGYFISRTRAVMSFYLLMT